MDKETISI